MTTRVLICNEGPNPVSVCTYKGHSMECLTTEKVLPGKWVWSTHIYDERRIEIRELAQEPGKV